MYIHILRRCVSASEFFDGSDRSDRGKLLFAPPQEVPVYGARLRHFLPHGAGIAACYPQLSALQPDITFSA